MLKLKLFYLSTTSLCTPTKQTIPASEKALNSKMMHLGFKKLKAKL